MVNMHALKAGKVNVKPSDDAYDVGIGTQFSAETNKRDEDEEMMKYGVRTAMDGPVGTTFSTAFLPSVPSNFVQIHRGPAEQAQTGPRYARRRQRRRRCRRCPQVHVTGGGRSDGAARPSARRIYASLRGDAVQSDAERHSGGGPGHRGEDPQHRGDRGGQGEAAAGAEEQGGRTVALCAREHGGELLAAQPM